MQKVINNGVFGGIPEEAIRHIVLKTSYFGVRGLACTSVYFNEMVKGYKGLYERFAEKEKIYKQCLKEVKGLEGLFTWGFGMKVWLVTHFYGGEEYRLNTEYFKRMEEDLRRDREVLEEKGIMEVGCFDKEKFWKEESVIERLSEGIVLKTIKEVGLERCQFAVKRAEGKYQKLIRSVRCGYISSIFVAGLSYGIARLLAWPLEYLCWDFLCWVDDVVMVVIAWRIMKGILYNMHVSLVGVSNEEGVRVWRGLRMGSCLAMVGVMIFGWIMK